MLLHIALVSVQIKDACVELLSAGTKISGNTRSPSPNSPAINSTNGARSGDLVTCKHCKKPVTANAIESHSAECLKKKQDQALRKKQRKEAKAREAKLKEAEEKEKEDKSKEQDKDGDSIMSESVPVNDINNSGGASAQSTKKPPKKAAAKASTSEGPKKSKKRKADGEGDKEPKKKKLKKDEPPKPKLPKQKGPVNVELQCGVALPNGGFCARSLTCKSHSMGAKRSVPGRSLPYDQLLAMYQKKNQAKQQKAMLQAAQPIEDDVEEGGAVDSDEERENVMKGIGRWRPRPLEQHIFVPTARKYKHVRMKEMLGNALGGRAGGGLFASARETAPMVADGIVQSPVVEGSLEGPRRGSMTQVTGHAHSKTGGTPVRKASIASSVGA